MRPREDWVPIKVPALISKDLFEKTAAQLKANYALITRHKKNDYLLAGIIYCVCGRRRTGEGPMHGKHLYYRCTDRVYSHPLPPKCKERGTNARIADVLVWNEVVSLMTSPKLLNQQIQRWMGKKKIKSEVSGDSADQLKLEIDRIKKEEARYIKAYGAEIINLEQFEDAMTDLKTRRNVLERQVGLLETQKHEVDDVAMPSEEQVKLFTVRSKLVLTGLSFELKQRIIRKVIDTVVADQRTVRVRGYLPIQQDQNVESRFKNRNPNFSFPYLEFKFGLTVPNPRKERIITERDKLGRIVHSRPPSLAI